MQLQLTAVGQIPTARVTGLPNMTALSVGDMAVSQVMPRWATLAAAGAMFTARAALQATSLAGTALVGLQLWNRTTNKNCAIVAVGGNVVATSATQTGVALAFGTQGTAAPTAQTAASNVINNLIGGAAPGALALNAATYAGAAANALDLLHNTAAIAVTGEDAGYFLDLEGAYMLPPGGYCAFTALGAAGAASSNNHWIMWAEIPV
jgi:hypothetical protein